MLIDCRNLAHLRHRASESRVIVLIKNRSSRIKSPRSNSPPIHSCLSCENGSIHSLLTYYFSVTNSWTGSRLVVAFKSHFSYPSSRLSGSFLEKQPKPAIVASGHHWPLASPLPISPHGGCPLSVNGMLCDLAVCLKKALFLPLTYICVVLVLRGGVDMQPP